MPVEVVYSDQVLSHHRHAHVSYEMLFILEGQAQMQVGGRKWMARGGDLVFLSPFEEHATALVQPPYRRYYALIPPDEMQAMGLEPELLSVFRMHGGDFPYALATGAWQARFEEYFSLLQEANARPRPGGGGKPTPPSPPPPPRGCSPPPLRIRPCPCSRFWIRWIGILPRPFRWKGWRGRFM